MKTLKPMTREEFENVLDKVDNANQFLKAETRIGISYSARKVAETSIVWENDYAEDGYVEVTFMYSEAYDNAEGSMVHSSFTLDAADPAFYICDLIVQIKDALNAVSFEDKAICLNTDVEILTRFEADINFFLLAKIEYLSTLYLLLDGRCLDIDSDDWQPYCK